MMEQSPGITRLLERLEARRLVRRVRCPEDRRQVLCHATAAAVRLVASLDAPMAESARRFLAPLDETRTSGLVEMLDAIRAAAAKALEPGTKPVPYDRTKETRE
jgi:DNA-binding MarR family transcriptional regulator